MDPRQGPIPCPGSCLYLCTPSLKAIGQLIGQFDKRTRVEGTQALSRFSGQGAVVGLSFRVYLHRFISRNG